MNASHTKADKGQAAAPKGLARQRQRSTEGARTVPLRILVPVDFSRPSGHALLAAASFARRYGGRLTLLTVIEPDPLHRFETDAAAVSRATLEGRLRSELSDFGRKLAGKDPLAAVMVRTGKPFEEIAKAARALQSDLIIIATHGHTGLKRVLLGSTTERVIRYAPCAVLTVRGGAAPRWPWPEQPQVV